MASKVLLQAEKRTISNSAENKRIRKRGLVPSIIYGKNISSVPITVKSDELRKVIRDSGRNAIIDLNVSGDKSYSVIISNVTFSRLTGGYEHVDFQNISMSDEIKAEVSLKVNGREMIESKRLVLIRQIDSIKVKGLPQDIPEFIEIDISNMEAGYTLTVGEVTLPDGIVLEEDNDTLILSVNAIKGESSTLDSSVEDTEVQEDE